MAIVRFRCDVEAAALCAFGCPAQLFMWARTPDIGITGMFSRSGLCLRSTPAALGAAVAVVPPRGARPDVRVPPNVSHVRTIRSDISVAVSGISAHAETVTVVTPIPPGDSSSPISERAQYPCARDRVSAESTDGPRNFDGPPTWPL